MNNETETVVTEFILSGFSNDLQTQRLLFVLFLSTYSLTICGNVFLTCIIITSSHLHSTMYYFICNLSFLDLFYSTSTVPNMLLDIISVKRGRISHTGCIVQMVTSLFLGQTECILLAVMAYDRYIAICFPLHYMVIMNWKKCKTITIIVWSGSFLNATVPVILKPFKFCKENNVDHYFCEIIALLKLACGDTFYYVAMISFSSLFSLLFPFAFILMSYICILRAILEISSVEGRNKAFSTCTSHLTVVFMFYGTCITIYLGSTKIPSENTKFISIMYIVIAPMLNPMIYSLRNNEVKRAVHNILIKC